MAYKGIVIGCGNIGALFEANVRRPKPGSHAGALVANPKTELSAFVGINEQGLAAARELFPDTRTYTDLKKCLQEVKPDIAIVATDTPAHREVIEICAEAKVSMIIGEKPIASSVEDARAIQKTVESSGSIFVLNYQRRFFPLFRDAAERIANGELGRIQQVTCYYSNGINNNGGHIIDALSFLLGDTIIAVLGIENKFNTMHPVNDQNIDGFLFTERGTSIALQSFDQKIFVIHEIRIYGEKGAVIISDYGYTVEWRTLGPSPFDGFPAVASDGEKTRSEISMTAGALNEVIACFEEKREPQSGIKNGIETLAVLEALRKSATTGTLIHV